MKFKNVFLLSILFIFISTTSALAEYSYSYGNEELNYADNCAYSASQAYLGLGFTSAYIWGYPFSQSAFLTNASVGNAIYAFTH